MYGLCVRWLTVGWSVSRVVLSAGSLRAMLSSGHDDYVMKAHASATPLCAMPIDTLRETMIRQRN